MKKCTYSIKGMHCASCEVVIERALKKVPGVHHVNVNKAKEQAIVECEENVSQEKLQEAVKEKGYTLHSLECDNPQTTNTSVPKSKRYLEIGAVSIVLIGIYFLLQYFKFIPALAVTDSMSYGFIFVLGLIAATSTCLAVSGGLLLALSTKFNQAHPNLTSIQRFRPHIFFNVGRILSYTIFGAGIGYLGSLITLSPAFTGSVTILVSILMIIIGLQMLHIFPWLDHIQIKMPKWIAHRIHEKSNDQEHTKHRTASFLFGAATFFLPCGFTQALQLYVLANANPAMGALTMLVFSLGTLPAFIGIGALSSIKKASFQRHFMTIAAVVVIFFGIVSISSGYTLVRSNIDLGSDPTSTIPPVPIINGVQIVEMTVDGIDYLPLEFTLKQGVPVEWRIDGTKAEGCTQVIAIPKLGITKRLSTTDITIVEFTPQKAGEIQFTCGMGMAGPGTFNVIE
ncbi:sulfite exporter TauE/SafE family protein [Candidatus Woesearchaeota archaeon]|nr:sulfite exporter TauE/SafE family protein [Candidatus Woesearchaeota archaeon]